MHQQHHFSFPLSFPFLFNFFVSVLSLVISFLGDDVPHLFQMVSIIR
jgi:hypothetical protein